MAGFETDRYVELPPYFSGLNPDKKVEVHYRSLPHWRQDAATYFFTIRLSDSLPREKLDQLQDEKRCWLEKSPKPHSDELIRELAQHVSTQVEKWLDAGAGSCALSDAKNAKTVSKAIEHFDGERYHLFASVVMGNHIHAIVKPLGNHDLDTIWVSWKKFTATSLKKRGVEISPLWFPEAYDRIIRDVKHLRNVVRYIGQNPIKAGKSREDCFCHIHPKWKTAGWDFDSEK